MKNTLLVKPGGTRGPGPLNILGDIVRIKLGGADTDGRFAIMEDRTEPQAGPPLHRHSLEDEWFYVLEGEYRFEVDGRFIHAGAGSSVLAPRGTAHTFQNVGSKPGRLLIFVEPAGLDMFFTELAAATEGMDQPDLAVVGPAFSRYGLELLGPPLGVRELVAAAAR